MGRRYLSIALLLLTSCSFLFAQEAESHFSKAASEAILPPPQPWNGKSRSLIVLKSNPWITPSEKSDFRTTPTYDETVAWLQKLDDASPQIKMVSIGKSAEGRDLWMVMVSREASFTPEAFKKSGKALVLAQAGIHAGEIDGKDAGLMLLRDMTVLAKKRDLLDSANFLFVPIFNVDGHERISRFNRVNQRGPEEMGWRTTATNLNLNRDYTKIDCPETEAMIRTIGKWQPDLYIDLHVTDGGDFQYDVTYGADGGHSKHILAWIENTLTPAVSQDLTSMGHTPGPPSVSYPLDEYDISKGIISWAGDPRYSTGYGDVRHLATVLVENHSLKPYEQRVLGDYVFLESAIRTTAAQIGALREAVKADCHPSDATVPLAWDIDPSEKPGRIDFKGIESRVVPDAISGGLRVEFTGKPFTLNIPWIQPDKVKSSVTRPHAYWVPASWAEIIHKLELHGIQFERLKEPRDVKVTMYRLQDMKFEPQPFEGHIHVTATTVNEIRTEHFPAGSIRIPTDQPLADLAVVLLEPASVDSFFQWGFFDSVLTETEYIEGYILGPMADRMLAEDPKLAEEFRNKLATDEAFRSSSKERLRWFYSKTPYVDDRWLLYPVGREE